MAIELKQLQKALLPGLEAAMAKRKPTVWEETARAICEIASAGGIKVSVALNLETDIMCCKVSGGGREERVDITRKDVEDRNFQELYKALGDAALRNQVAQKNMYAGEFGVSSGYDGAPGSFGYVDASAPGSYGGYGPGTTAYLSLAGQPRVVVDETYQPKLDRKPTDYQKTEELRAKQRAVLRDLGMSNENVQATGDREPAAPDLIFDEPKEKC